MIKTYLRLILGKIVSAFCERWDLVLENVALRHQIGVLERSGRRPQFTNVDRLVWVVLSTVWPRWPEALEIVNVDTVKRWRRQGFRHHLLGKSRRRRPGRPAIEPEPQSLIRRMSRQNGLWGAPRIHGELLKLGVDVCQTTVAKYMVRRVGPPSQHWGTFLHNHVRELVPSEIFLRLIRSFRTLITWIGGAS
jgi:putative transposase